ncbi:MAG: hypothetical protein HYT30_00910 [Parcubacteria group bacterium]|nr:hypothetical protein [Parcubacteria group bacterium]
MNQRINQHRVVVEKIIAATQKNIIVWEHSTFDVFTEFFGDFQGWRLRARWLQDETGLTLVKYIPRGGCQTITIGYRDMLGLREAIYAQSHIAAAQKTQEEQRRASLCKTQKAVLTSERKALRDFLRS